MSTTVDISEGCDVCSMCGGIFQPGSLFCAPGQDEDGFDLICRTCSGLTKNSVAVFGLLRYLSEDKTKARIVLGCRYASDLELAVTIMRAHLPVASELRPSILPDNVAITCDAQGLAKIKELFVSWGALEDFDQDGCTKELPLYGVPFEMHIPLDSGGGADKLEPCAPPH